MLLAAQSMAVGTVMVRWLCQFADPVMATGWVGFEPTGNIKNTHIHILNNKIFTNLEMKRINSSISIIAVNNLVSSNKIY